VYNIAPVLVPSAAPRIRTYNVQPPSPTGAAAAAAKLKNHADSSQIQGLLNPVQGPRDAQVRAGIKPFDHAKSNIAAIKEQSKLNALQKMSSQDNGSGAGAKAAAAARSTSAPTRRVLQRPPSDNGRDFINENRVNAAAPQRPPRPDGKADDGLKYLQKRDYGRVPNYLLERKVEMLEQQEQQLRAKEAAMIPPGMRMLPEEERLETLAILQKNRQEVERALQVMPIIIETPSQKRRKDDLERRLREIEDAFKIFSRPKVLVHV